MAEHPPSSIKSLISNFNNMTTSNSPSSEDLSKSLSPSSCPTTNPSLIKSHPSNILPTDSTPTYNSNQILTKSPSFSNLNTALTKSPSFTKSNLPPTSIPPKSSVINPRPISYSNLDKPSDTRITPVNPFQDVIDDPFSDRNASTETTPLPSPASFSPNHSNTFGSSGKKGSPLNSNGFPSIPNQVTFPSHRPSIPQQPSALESHLSARQNIPRTHPVNIPNTQHTNIPAISTLPNPPSRPSTVPSSMQPPKVPPRPPLESPTISHSSSLESFCISEHSKAKPQIPPRPKSPIIASKTSNLRPSLSPKISQSSLSSPGMISSSLGFQTPIFPLSSSSFPVTTSNAGESRPPPPHSPSTHPSTQPSHSYNTVPPLCDFGTKHDHPLRYPTRFSLISHRYICHATSDLIRFWHLELPSSQKRFPSPDKKILCGCLTISTHSNNNLSTNPSNLWVGLDNGEIIQFDMASATLLQRKSVHSFPINHILYSKNPPQLITIDTTGVIKVWAYPFSLDQTPTISRIAGKSVAACMHGDLIILVLEKSSALEIYSTEFKVIKRVTLGVNVSCVCSSGRNGFLALAHDNGTVSVWDASSLMHRMTIPICSYKLTCLLVISNYIWVGSITGKVYILNTITSPFKLIKDINAFISDDVSILSIDSESTFQSHCILLCGSENGPIRFLDGFLSDDYIGLSMQIHQSRYCSFENIKIVIGSWNVNALKTSKLRSNDDGVDTFREWLLEMNEPDIIVIGFQEITDLEAKSSALKMLRKEKKHTQASIEDEMRLWMNEVSNLLKTHIPTCDYTCIDSRQLVGLLLFVFVKNTRCADVRHICSCMVKTGLAGFHGNKGAVMVRFIMYDSSFCFVNCHLAAHQKEVLGIVFYSFDLARNQDCLTIMRKGDFKAITDEPCALLYGNTGIGLLDHETVFWFGDMNYRIDLPRRKVIESISQSNWSYLLQHDQLRKQMNDNPLFVLNEFTEAELDFAPTFKYDVGTHVYDTSDKQRVPAWCDRILWRGDRITMNSMKRIESTLSDHKPILGSFIVQAKCVDEHLFQHVYESVFSNWKAEQARLVDLAIEQMNY